MKFLLLHSLNNPGQWILHIPNGKSVREDKIYYHHHTFQYFSTWQCAVDYFAYLTKPRNYDWKTIHK